MEEFKIQYEKYNEAKKRDLEKLTNLGDQIIVKTIKISTELRGIDEKDWNEKISQSWMTKKYDPILTQLFELKKIINKFQWNIECQPPLAPDFPAPSPEVAEDPAPPVEGGSGEPKKLGKKPKAEENVIPESPKEKKAIAKSPKKEKSVAEVPTGTTATESPKKKKTKVQEEIPPEPIADPKKEEVVEVPKPMEKAQTDESKIPIAERRKKIPKAIRTIVWNKYIGADINHARCMCCRSERIGMNNWHCGHVIAESKGGDLNINNLRPICAPCNQSMGTRSMNEFTSEYFGWTI